jgi:predicted enzyme related to lactoylglutathione lyase
MHRPIHFEILVENPEQVGEFYEKVFGWEMARWEGGEQGYWLLTTGPAEVPGINGALMGTHFPQAVINTLEVPDLQAAIEQVKSAGGKLVHGPNEVPGAGVHAYCADPAGVLFGMMQPARE